MSQVGKKIMRNRMKTKKKEKTMNGVGDGNKRVRNSDQGSESSRSSSVFTLMVN
jgi:hypothetical protein